MSSGERYRPEIIVEDKKIKDKEVLSNSISAIRKIEAILAKTNLVSSFAGSVEGSELEELLQYDPEDLVSNEYMDAWDVETKGSESFTIRVIFTTEPVKNGNFEANSLFCLSASTQNSDPAIQIFVNFIGREQKWQISYEKLDEDDIVPEIQRLLADLGANDAVIELSEEEALNKIEFLCQFMKAKLATDEN